jgi:hypothetical protein
MHERQHCVIWCTWAAEIVETDPRRGREELLWFTIGLHFTK